MISGDNQDSTTASESQGATAETNDQIFQTLATSSATHHDAKEARNHKAKPTDDFSGTWTLSSAPTIQFAQLTLTQTGKRIQGSILDDDVQATVTGKVTGDRLTGRFMAPKTSDHPKIKFKIDATQTDEHSMTGTIKVTAKGIHQTTNFTGAR
jgi:hypothetical protein